MAANSVTNVYLHVMDDVIANMTPDFQNEGVNESVLDELKALWELKLLQTGAITTPDDVPSGVGGAFQADLNVSFHNSDEDFGVKAPSFDATGGGEDKSFQNDDAFGKPEPFLANASAYADGRRTLGMDLNRAGEEDEEDFSDEEEYAKDIIEISAPSGAKRQRRDESGMISQVDGAEDRVEGPLPLQSEQLKRFKEWEVLKEAYMEAASIRETGAAIPQLDGEDDDEVSEEGEEGDDEVPGVAKEEEEEEEEEDYNEAGDVAEVKPVGGSREHGSEDIEDDNEELGEEDDDEYDDPDDPEAGQNDPETENAVLATFDKVTRSKNRWKCVLKDGIVKLNGRDLLFVKANGEFEF